MKALDALDDSCIVEVRSYKDMLDLFEKLEYTPETWQAGIRKVPRLYLTVIGDRWGSSTTKEITVEYKKRLFFRGLAPLILRSNELILEDRNRLEGIKVSFQQNPSLPEMDQIWVRKLAALYKVKTGEGHVTASMLEELWIKVDIIPPSLALAQGAEESGWGTSRFAAAGNAIYGQWTWGKNAIVPEQQRKELGNYGIAAFGSLQESICAYMLNLNTHSAYADLRSKRAELRSKGEKVTGSVLSEQLTKYSERGEEYVKTLKIMMDYNHLNPVDDAYLSNDPPLFLIPVAGE
ncbi:MAG: glucosaminidase domain-containing protein [Bacteroidota bacterium]